jgi:hypothetical protein
MQRVQGVADEARERLNVMNVIDAARKCEGTVK